MNETGSVPLRPLAVWEGLTPKAVLDLPSQISGRGVQLSAPTPTCKSLGRDLNALPECFDSSWDHAQIQVLPCGKAGVWASSVPKALAPQGAGASNPVPFMLSCLHLSSPSSSSNPHPCTLSVFLTGQPWAE